MEPNQNSSGMLNNFPRTPKDNNRIGPIIGALVIVLIVVIVAIYFFGKKLNTDMMTPDRVDSTAQVDNANNTNSSIPADVNEGAAIEADLDSQLKDIDYSF